MITTLLVAAGLAQAPLVAEPSINPDASPRELYVSCSLALTGNRLLQDKADGQFKAQAPATCLVLALRSLKRAEAELEGSPMKLCFRGAADFTADPPKALALVFVQYFEKNPEKLNNVRGSVAMTAAYIDKWSCSK